MLAAGAIGEIVRQIQTALAAAGFDPKGTDGWFGQDTAAAVAAFQAARFLPATGDVDDGTWQILMQRPVPSAAERSLQLTASFEAHGFGLAMGNFDDALLTWGIIGFTLASGEVQAIVLGIYQLTPALVRQAFGRYTEELIRILQAPGPEQEAWANSLTLASGALAQPWRAMFDAFGSLPRVQQEQTSRAMTRYMAPAIATARDLGLTSELGLALCFDIHVQNGGVKPKVMKRLREQIAGVPEAQVRAMLAHAVADSASSRWREDVRCRKLAIATGSGRIHGHDYVLAHWGLDGNTAAAELSAALVAPA